MVLKKRRWTFGPTPRCGFGSAVHSRSPADHRTESGDDLGEMPGVRGDALAERRGAFADFRAERDERARFLANILDRTAQILA
jgi:hypothetical protein